MNLWQLMWQRWQRWVEPAPQIQPPEARLEARFLASMFLVLALITMLTNPLRYLIDFDQPFALERLGGALIGVLLLLAAYALARSGRTFMLIRFIIGGTIVLLLGVGGMTGGVVGTNALHYLIIPILFASLFTSLKLTLAAFSAIMLGLTLLPALMPSIALVDIARGPMPFILVVTAMSCLFAYYRQQLESMRQNRLREDEERYRIISEMISDYAFRYRVQPDGSLVNEWHTGSFIKVTGYELNAIEINDIQLVFDPEDRDRLDRDVAATLTGETTCGEYRIRHADGMLHWVQVDRKPLLDADGKVSVYYGVCQDITARKQAEARQMALALHREWVRLVGRFVLALSHDFRNVLMRIETNSYLLQRQLEKSEVPRAMERIEGVQAAVQHMVRQLDTLNMVSALTNLNREACAVNPLVSDLIEQHMADARAKNLSVVFAPNPHIPDVQADRAQIITALRHLVVNAVHFTPPGGSITLRTHPGHQVVRIEIRDTGPGIAAEHLPRIFELFYRADEARPLAQGGVGLGLSLAMMIVEAHGGSIQVESQPGAGTAFFVSLPIAAEDQ